MLDMSYERRRYVYHGRTDAAAAHEHRLPPDTDSETADKLSELVPLANFPPASFLPTSTLRSTRSSSYRWLLVAVLVLSLLGLCSYLTLRVHELGGFDESVTFGGTPRLMNVSQWLRRTDDTTYMLSHGIDLRPPIPRQFEVDAHTVTRFRELIRAKGLVDGYNNTLILGITNYGYRDFAYNWLCFIRRVNLTNFLLACVDKESCEELTLLGYGKHVVLLDELIPSTGNYSGLCDSAATHKFRSPCFNRQTKLKTHLVLISLLAGYNTVLSDMDISLVHNPFLYMPLSFDWEIQLEPDDLCTGWYYNAATPLAIRMQAEVLYAMGQHPQYDDQVLYNAWAAYQLFINSDDFVRRFIFPLNRELFPNGKSFATSNAVLWHNNWLTTAQEKRERMKQHMIYLYQEAETQSAVKAYVAQLPVGLTNGTERDNNKPVWRAMNGSSSRTAISPPNPLLVCAVCTACVNLTAAQPPLRSTFPGKLLISNFTNYTSPWPRFLLSRLFPKS